MTSAKVRSSDSAHQPSYFGETTELASLMCGWPPAMQEVMWRVVQVSLAVMCPASHEGRSVNDLVSVTPLSVPWILLNFPVPPVSVVTL